MTRGGPRRVYTIVVREACHPDDLAAFVNGGMLLPRPVRQPGKTSTRPAAAASLPGWAHAGSSRTGCPVSSVVSASQHRELLTDIFVETERIGDPAWVAGEPGCHGAGVSMILSADGL
jgi:hypothetical protein